MKIKIKLGLNQASITFLFFSGFLLGVVIAGVALLGSQIPLKCFDAGNAADWIAAIGTWVIGIGAMKIAYDANVRRKQDVEAERLAKLNAREAALRLIGTDARTAQAFESNLQSKFDGAGNVKLESLRIFLEIAKKKLGTIRWDFSQKTELGLDIDTLQALIGTEHELLAVIDYCERFLALYPADLQSYDPNNCQIMRWMKECATSLTKDAKALERSIYKELFGSFKHQQSPSGDPSAEPASGPGVPATVVE